MKKKHPFLYNVIRRSIVVILLAMMVLMAYNQSTGSLVSPEGFLAKIITPVQGFVSQASQNISSYLYRVKLRSNIEYEYNQLKAQNDELTLRSILYEELEQENAQLRALLGEYETRSTMNPMLRRAMNVKLRKVKHKSYLELMLICFFLTLMREIVYIGYLFLIGAEQSMVTILRALLCAAYSSAMILPGSFVVHKIMSVHPFKRKHGDDLTGDSDVMGNNR